MPALRDSIRWHRTAYHEAGHAICARLLGAGSKSITVRDDFSGEAVYLPGTLSARDRACISVAGAIAEARFVDAGHPCFPGSGANWKRSMSEGDWRQIIALAESAGIPTKRHGLFLDDMSRLARTILLHNWSDVQRVVSFLYESAGPIRLKAGERLLYETLAPTPAPTPAPMPDIAAGLGRLARRAAELWGSGAIYP